MIKKKSQCHTETRTCMRGGTGSVTITHYFYPGEIKARCRLCARLVIPSGASIGLHEHVKEDEVFIIEEGSGIVNDNGEDFEVEAGDAIVTGNNTAHAIRNTGSGDLVITAVIMQYD